MAEDRFPNWEKQPDGNIVTLPVTGWELAAFPLNVLVRLAAVDQSGEAKSIQVHLPAAKVREFAEALSRTADQALAIGLTDRAQ